MRTDKHRTNIACCSVQRFNFATYLFHWLSVVYVFLSPGTAVSLSISVQSIGHIEFICVTQYASPGSISFFRRGFSWMNKDLYY